MLCVCTIDIETNRIVVRDVKLMLVIKLEHGLVDHFISDARGVSEDVSSSIKRIATKVLLASTVDVTGTSEPLKVRVHMVRIEVSKPSNRGIVVYLSAFAQKVNFMVEVVVETEMHDV